MSDLEPARDYEFHRLDERPQYGNPDHIGGYTVEIPGQKHPNRDTKTTLQIRCPGEESENATGKCGWLLQLDHGVTEDGEVKPSVGCPHCGFHAWATLKDWEHWGLGEYDPNGYLS